MDNLKKMYIFVLLLIIALCSVIYIQQKTIRNHAGNLFKLEQENEELVKKRSELNYKVDELTSEIEKYKNN